MKKSELRKLIREVISEQSVNPLWSAGCEPGPNCVAPEFNENTWGSGMVTVTCPSGFILQSGAKVQPQFMPDNPNPVGLRFSRCVPDIGSPGDMAGHGSTDDPFVPGMGFEDQFIDQITGPGGPFGGSAKSGGSGKGKPIRESKKRHK